MGCFASKKRSMRGHEEEYVRGLRERMRLLQEEVSEMMWGREKESRAYEEDVMVFAIKEAEWKRERRRLKEEMKRLRKVVEEKDERIRGMELDGVVVVGEKPCGEKDHDHHEWQLLGNSFMVEQMREERARRDEAVEKWKRLYLDIKTELDDLIQRTHHGEYGLYWRAEEEDIMEELRMELKAKESTIEALKARLASMEHEEYKREREIDILRQSLRIMSSTKPSSLGSRSHPKFTLVKHTRKV